MFKCNVQHQYAIPKVLFFSNYNTYKVLDLLSTRTAIFKTHRNAYLQIY